jgi:hypothetical protein
MIIALPDPENDSIVKQEYCNVAAKPQMTDYSHATSACRENPVARNQHQDSDMAPIKDYEFIDYRAESVNSQSS